MKLKLKMKLRRQLMMLQRLMKLRNLHHTKVNKVNNSDKWTK